MISEQLSRINNPQTVCLDDARAQCCVIKERYVTGKHHPCVTVSNETRALRVNKLVA